MMLYRIKTVKLVPTHCPSNRTAQRHKHILQNPFLAAVKTTVSHMKKSSQITTVQNNISQNPAPSSRIPFRPRKIRKLTTDTLNIANPTAASTDSLNLPKILKPLSFEGEIDIALQHLRRIDPLLATLIDAHRPPTFESCRSPFLSLAKSILYQQLATKAAKSIYARFISLLGGEDRVLPDAVLAASAQQLREIGVSFRKASYLHDLSEKFKNGVLSDESIIEMDDETMFKMLTSVKGIGPWSVHMFMMFSLHKPDVLPVGDLGVRKGVQVLYGLKELPGPLKMEEVCEKWRPYRSVGSWYMWRLMEARGASPNVAEVASAAAVTSVEAA
ncbi:DNA-3-methyladenine glycosylase [Melia azedarach]|uniref:DNA-3-methyladenine glycosylase n=1 Tax=Melia azedarach TaxID=155640 RepID=A0ACC1XTW7_MELAZ|nr:DNA-3-methyladenine glycosylase [Melia azedarach]